MRWPSRDQDGFTARAFAASSSVLPFAAIRIPRRDPAVDRIETRF
jgi:hypothetical protein